LSDDASFFQCIHVSARKKKQDMLEAGKILLRYLASGLVFGCHAFQTHPFFSRSGAPATRSCSRNTIAVYIPVSRQAPWERSDVARSHGKGFRGIMEGCVGNVAGFGCTRGSIGASLHLKHQQNADLCNISDFEVEKTADNADVVGRGRKKGSSWKTIDFLQDIEKEGEGLDDDEIFTDDDEGGGEWNFFDVPIYQ
jgi:hypothetical protein